MTHIVRGDRTFGNFSAGNYARFDDDGSLQLYGDATHHEDLRVEALAVKVGVTAPTDTVGFRGNNDFQDRRFVHNQADEVQFSIQMPHGWKEGSTIEPHVHFCPTTTDAAGTVQFGLAYYVASVGGTFPATPGTVLMKSTWSANSQWVHLIAEGTAAPITMTGQTLSSVLKCRLYRDNSVTGNLEQAVSFLWFDAHIEVDSFGSRTEYTK